jgi:acetyl-CoA synthetase
MSSTAFLEARDLLLEHRTDYEAAYQAFAWPDLADDFNWARDYFDPMAAGNEAKALHLVEEAGDETVLTYDQLARRSRQVAAFLSGLGAEPGDRVLIMLGNEVALWEAMLASLRLGLVMIPATTLLSGSDLADRFTRGGVRLVVANATGREAIDALDPSVVDAVIKVAAGPEGELSAGWRPLAESSGSPEDFTPEHPPVGSDPLFEYFTSGTTSKPKLVRHTQLSYPVGHLSTMYWMGIQPGDVHWTLSSPGWAKHAWGCFFAPFNAQACIFVYNYERFDAPAVLDVLVQHKVTTLCAPPTVWRFLVQEDIASYPVVVREALSAGEPLNPEIIESVRSSWNVTIRDGYGQTETTAQVGNPPGAELKPGSMGRPMPGYTIDLLDPDGRPATEGELSIAFVDGHPLPLMARYADDDERTAEVMDGKHYRTGDVAERDADGYITYVGRSDDVFKASGYRISPFELESVLVEHPAVAEAAVVPSPDELRGNVPKAYVVLAAGVDPDQATAADILGYVRDQVPGYKLIRRIEFADLPKTISGKIRRVDLRKQESTRDGQGPRTDAEFIEADLRG